MYETLLESALKIPPNERVVLAELILESIDHEDESIRKDWMDEVKNRMDAVKNGKAKLHVTHSTKIEVTIEELAIPCLGNP